MRALCLGRSSPPTPGLAFGNIPLRFPTPHVSSSERLSQALLLPLGRNGGFCYLSIRLASPPLSPGCYWWEDRVASKVSHTGHRLLLAHEDAGPWSPEPHIGSRAPCEGTWRGHR